MLIKMRCVSYCNAESYNIAALGNHLVTGDMEPKYFGDVIHYQKQAHNKIIDIFCFPFGCVTIWNASEIEEDHIISEVGLYGNKEIFDPAIEVVYYSYEQSSDKTYINEEKNEIILNSDSIFLKFAISYGLAQSVKLSILEGSVSKIIAKTGPIQKELSYTGKISLSKKDLSKMIGKLFNERYEINMHSDILDIPEFFWKRPNYEPIYLATVNFQDIALRQNILDRRLNSIQELYKLLSDELNHKQSARIEIVIVILIAIEVLLGFSNYLKLLLDNLRL